MKIYLRVPFAEKDIAKKLGAKWDGNVKRWYLPESVSPNAFAKWMPPSSTPIVTTSGTITATSYLIVPKVVAYEEPMYRASLKRKWS